MVTVMTDFEAGDYTGVVAPPKEVMEAWYHRFKDICHFLQQRSHGLAINRQDQGLVKDSLERMQEDDTWPHGREVPPVFVMPDVTAGEILAVDPETAKVLTLAAVNKSRKGFGQFRGLWTPGSQGISDPWSSSRPTHPHHKGPRTDQEQHNARK
jgi:hypothetical protein